MGRSLNEALSVPDAGSESETSIWDSRPRLPPECAAHVDRERALRQHSAVGCSISRIAASTKPETRKFEIGVLGVTEVREVQGMGEGERGPRPHTGGHARTHRNIPTQPCSLNH